MLTLEQQQKADEILGKLKSDPSYLIQAIWDNNSPALADMLRTNGLPLCDSPAQVLDLMARTISTGQLSGQKWAYMMASIPTNYYAGNYTTSPEFIEAFNMFDYEMGAKF